MCGLSHNFTISTIYALTSFFSHGIIFTWLNCSKKNMNLVWFDLPAIFFVLLIANSSLFLLIHVKWRQKENDDTKLLFNRLSGMQKRRERAKKIHKIAENCYYYLYCVWYALNIMRACQVSEPQETRHRFYF